MKGRTYGMIDIKALKISFKPQCFMGQKKHTQQEEKKFKIRKGSRATAILKCTQSHRYNLMQHLSFTQCWKTP